MRRRALVALAAGTFTTSASFAESACGSTPTRLPTDAAAVTDQRLAPRAAVALIVVVAVTVLLRLAGTGSQPELPDTWRPYG